MNKLAEGLNQASMANTPSAHSMFSSLGQALFYPKGILSQTAAAKQKATFFIATISTIDCAP